MIAVDTKNANGALKMSASANAAGGGLPFPGSVLLVFTNPAGNTAGADGGGEGVWRAGAVPDGADGGGRMG